LPKGSHKSCKSGKEDYPKFKEELEGPQKILVTQESKERINNPPTQAKFS